MCVCTPHGAVSWGNRKAPAQPHHMQVSTQTLKILWTVVKSNKSKVDVDNTTWDVFEVIWNIGSSKWVILWGSQAQGFWSGENKFVHMFAFFCKSVKFTTSSLELFLFVSNSHPSHPAQIHKTARFFSTFTLLWSKIMQCSQYLVPYLFGLSWWSSAMVTYTIGTCLAIFMECMVFLAAVIMKTMGSATELIGVTTAVVHSNISVGYWSRNMETK